MVFAGRIVENGPYDIYIDYRYALKKVFEGVSAYNW